MDVSYRFYVLMLYCCMAVFSVFAQYKVVERSAKQEPEWTRQAIPGYLIMSAEAATLDMARKICMENIKNEMVYAVAVNISATTTSFSEQTHAGSNFVHTEGFRSDMKSVAARLPFLSGITIANVEAFYWEKRYDAGRKEYSYHVFLKYPFSHTERDRLIAEFRQYDAEKYKKLTDIKSQVDGLDNVDDIARYLTGIEPLIAYFFDETRKAEAISLQKNLRLIYKNIAVVPITSSLGRYTYALMYNGRRLHVSRLPVTRSEYAGSISIVPQPDTTFLVTYDYAGCLPEDENTIDLIFNFGGNTVKHQFHFDLSVERLEVIPQGKLSICVYGTTDIVTIADSVILSFVVRAKYETRFVIASMQLSSPDFRQTLFLPVSDNAIIGKGIHRVDFKAVQVSCRKESGRAALSVGTMKVKNMKDGQLETLLVRLPYEMIYY